MELSRLFPKPLSELGHRYRNLREFLAEVLEGNRSLLGEDEKQNALPPFQVSNQFEKLEKIPVKNRAIVQRFSDLAPYFEAGAYLSQTGKVTKLNGLFVEGKVFVNENEAPPIQLNLSQLKPGKIVKGRSESVLRALGLDEAKRFADADAFAFSPSKGSIIVLICNRPALWQNDALEAAFDHAGAE
ncbi:MAG TPA: hypothetical protein VM432_14040 [Bdellovibrionales bacterium]|jgi:hypothetical protein|nr:hypothetical protein [Bdellovibrionales bacterium]